MTNSKPKGWLYIITNRAMPGLVKVGYTMKDPKLRARDLQGTGVPHPYDVLYEALLPDPYIVEQRVHRALAAHREGKEWFRCDASLAYEAIRRVASSGIVFETSYPNATDSTKLLGEFAFRAWEASTDLEQLNDAVRHHYPPAIEYAISFFHSEPSLNTARFDLAELKRELFHHYVAAGDNGDASAYFNAVCFAEGDDDIEVREEEINRLLCLASDGGCVAAIARLATNGVENAKSPEDVSIGIEQLERLLRDGYWQAGLSLAKFYEAGKYVPIDRRRSLFYWDKVASLSGGSLWRTKAERLRASLENDECLPLDQPPSAA